LQSRFVPYTKRMRMINVMSFEEFIGEEGKGLKLIKKNKKFKRKNNRCKLKRKK